MWEILGIPPTCDVRKIKEAYSRLAKEHNPEEQPEEFRKLHEAYRSACEYARMVNNFRTGGRPSRKSVLPASEISGEDEFDFQNIGGENGDAGRNDRSADTGPGGTEEEFDFSAVGEDTVILPDSDSGEKEESEEGTDGGAFEVNEDITAQVAAAIVLTAMKCLLNDSVNRGRAESWNNLFCTNAFCDSYKNTSFRKLAAELLYWEVFEYDTANVIANRFGFGTKLVCVGSYPVREYVVRVSEKVSGEKKENAFSDILRTGQDIGDNIKNFFGKLF